MHNPIIVLNKNILGGRPIIQGTRIAVSAVLAQLKNGHGTGVHVKDTYPQLTEKQIDAVIEYARKSLDEKFQS